MSSDREFGSIRPGDVLVCPITTPAWSLNVGRIGALVTDAGGALSHAAIVACEHGIPGVVATGRATTELSDGLVVTVDGSAGTLADETRQRHQVGFNGWPLIEPHSHRAVTVTEEVPD